MKPLRLTKTVGTALIMCLGLTSAGDSVADGIGTPDAYGNNPINIDIKYLYYRDGWDNYKTLKNGSVLYRGRDFLKVIFTPSERLYVYIFQKGSTGNIYRLFPMLGFRNKVVNNLNPVLPGVDYYVPKENQAFSLGGLPGKETLYFIISKERDEELEDQYHHILYADSLNNPAAKNVAQRAFEEGVLTRDITDIVYDQVYQKTTPTDVYELNEAGKRFIVIRDRLLGCDGCVSRVTYELK